MIDTFRDITIDDVQGCIFCFHKLCFLGTWIYASDCKC